MKPLLLLLLFSGLVPVLVSVPRRFYLIKQTKNWNDAQTYCRANHEDLATIESAADLVKLNKLGPAGWVGLYLSWRWSLGNQEVVNPKYWLVGTGTIYTCGSIHPSGWWSYPCTNNFQFMCFDDRYTGNCRYKYYTSGYTWSQAQAYCRQYHTDLASARDAVEDSVLHGMTANYLVWIGLYLDTWRWSDQSPMSYMPWLSGQPSYTSGPNDCGYFSTSGTYEAPCTNLNVFFCYGIITGQQQIVKVKVRSNQNVNNATMNSMLEMIELKLKKLGVNGVTVRWRKQPDGRVLQK